LDSVAMPVADWPMVAIYSRPFSWHQMNVLEIITILHCLLNGECVGLCM